MIHAYEISRRRALLALAAVPAALHLSARAQGDATSIRVCQSTALTGPLGDLGQALHQGAVACFTAVNAQGGVNGRKIDLVTLDDGYDVKRALANVETFLNDHASFALFNCMGTPMVEAMLP